MRVFDVSRPVHVLVVDPGVGTSRRLLLARTRNHFFLSPDNGALGLVFDQEPVEEIYAITASHYFRLGRGDTFQGRDVLAPVAARVARGLGLSHFGEPVSEWISFLVPPPSPTSGQGYLLRVLHVDRYGNVILNVRKEAIEAWREQYVGGPFAIRIEGKSVDRELRTYGESDSPEPFALFNSCGFLELAVRNGSAAALLGTSPFREVVVSFGTGPAAK